MLLATHMMMGLIDQDAQFAQDIKKIVQNPQTRLLCQQHLLRSRDATPSGIDPIEHGIKQTALEGVMSVSAAYGGTIEANGIPGYELNLWEGLSATIDQQIATQITSRMPAGVVAAQTIYGNRFIKPLMHNEGRIRIHPAVDAKWQQIREKRIAIQHAAWLAHRASDANDSIPPVRFGLYCPFKGKVVKKMAETLMVCRAIAHN